jgi:hypothetical protein
MQPQIELSFVWRRRSIKESIIAVTKAVGAGFNTKEALTASLPQFSIYRIALAIDALITAGMAENNLGVLSIHPDMDIVFELADSKLELPLTVDEADASMRRVIINKLGFKNPAGVESLLRAKIVEA